MASAPRRFPRVSCGPVQGPDADPSSKASVPVRAEANPYHLRELDREELETLLREHFPDVSLLGQNAATGSYIGLARGRGMAALSGDRRRELGR